MEQNVNFLLYSRGDRSHAKARRRKEESELCALAPLREILLEQPIAIERHYKKNLRAPQTACDCLQLRAAAQVAGVLLHSTFPRGKNLWIFPFEGPLSGLETFHKWLFHRYLRERME